MPPRMPPALAPAIPPSGPIPVAPQAQIAAAGGEVMPREIIISIAPTAPASAEVDMARANNWVILDRAALPQVGVRAMRCRLAARRPVQDAVASARTDARTVNAQANYIYRPSQGKNQGSSLGQKTSSPSTSDLQYALAKLDLGDVHLLSTGRGAKIAIIDTGIDASHPDFDGAAFESFDALGGAKPEPGTHGTAVAGIIAARGTMRGVAPAATLMSIRAFPSDKSKEPQMTTSFVLLKAMDWSLAHGARVINLSLAGPRDPLMEKAVAAAAAKGVIMIAAAGNNGDKAPPAFPAAYADVIAVTAIDARDQLYTRANHGAYIAVAAPGVDVLALARGKGHDLQSGTSFAAAHVSGIVALMLERDASLGAAAVRRALVESAVDLGEPGRDDAFGAGRASAAAALRWEAKP
jgi:subtilisin family serine protease